MHLLNSSGGSFTATASSTVEPPITIRQNGDGTEAPPAPLAPIFESHSESVPVDGKPGNYLIVMNLKANCLIILVIYCRRRSGGWSCSASILNGRL